MLYKISTHELISITTKLRITMANKKKENFWLRYGTETKISILALSFGRNHNIKQLRNNGNDFGFVKQPFWF